MEEILKFAASSLHNLDLVSSGSQQVLLSLPQPLGQDTPIGVWDEHDCLGFVLHLGWQDGGILLFSTFLILILFLLLPLCSPFLLPLAHFLLFLLIHLILSLLSPLLLFVPGCFGREFLLVSGTEGAPCTPVELLSIIFPPLHLGFPSSQPTDYHLPGLLPVIPTSHYHIDVCLYHLEHLLMADLVHHDVTHSPDQVISQDGVLLGVTHGSPLHSQVWCSH